MSVIAEPSTSKLERKKFKGKVYTERVKKRKTMVISQPSFEKNFDDSGPEENVRERETDEGEYSHSETPSKFLNSAWNSRKVASSA